LAQKLIEDWSALPIDPYGNWNESMLVDEDLASDINLYLQELGSSISAHKVVEFLAQPDVKEKHGITKSITKRTARQYLNALGFRWASPKKEQYADGHEHADVVWYHNPCHSGGRLSLRCRHGQMIMYQSPILKDTA
jgi:hypothetical protein